MAHWTDSADSGCDARHLVKGMSLRELLEAANLGHVKFRTGYVPVVVKVDRNLGVTFDAAHGFDCDALHPTLLSELDFHARGWFSSFQQIVDHRENRLRWRRTSRQADINLHELADRPRFLQQSRHAFARNGFPLVCSVNVNALQQFGNGN